MCPHEVRLTRLDLRRGGLVVAAVLLGAWAVLMGPRAHAGCTVTVDSMNFGSVNTLAGDLDATANLNIQCTGFATPYVRVCASLAGTRTLTGSGGTLQFQLYNDAARTQVWGSVWSAPESATVSANIPLDAGAGSAVVPYYGRIQGGQTGAGLGAYSRILSSNDTALNAFAYSSTPPVCNTGGFQGQFSMSLSASVVADCTVSASNVDFGTLGILATAVNATGVVTAACTKGSSYNLSLSVGLGVGGTMAQRLMTRSGGSETLTYGLYRDSGRTQLWGDGTGGSSTVSNTGTGSPQTSTIYGTVPAQGAPRPGTYADTITVTVTF